jgi:two-component system chemotaxis sensor kinase CheA
MTSEMHLSREEVAALKETFRAQAMELLEEYSHAVLELEHKSQSTDLLKAIQRVVHTLKGDSMSLEFVELAKLAHRLEDLLEFFRNQDKPLQRSEIDALLQCGDGMSSLLESYCKEPAEPPMDIQPLCQQLDDAIDARTELPNLYRLTLTFNRKCNMRSAGAFLVRQRLEPLSRIVETHPDPESAEIETSKEWSLVLETSSPPKALSKAARVTGVSSRVKIEPYITTQDYTDVSPSVTSIEGGDREDPNPGSAETTPRGTPSDQLRMDVAKIDRIMNLVGELVIGRSMVSQSLSEMSKSDEAAVSRLNTANNFLEQTLTELQSVVLKIRMVPVDHVFRRFPRVVRDLSNASGKEIELEIEGASTELDKSIVDALHEPLLHLVRNAIDHGIESPKDRKRMGKSSAGRLKLAAFYEGNHVHILIEDDGLGIDLDLVKERAVLFGFGTQQELDALPREEVLNVIFQPGFSTRESISTVSGRGIGMDIVRKAIEDLKGTIDVSTNAGRGTRFLIRLPLTLAILKSILVESASRTFAIPLSGVLEIVRLHSDSPGTVLGKDVLRLRDRVVPLVDLQHALGLDRQGEQETRRGFVILAGEAERRVGLVVDQLLGEHELVVKPLEDPLVKSPGIAGASILGDGKVVLILNLRGLIDRKRRIQRRSEVNA